MTLTAGVPWGHAPRPWGYEVRVDFTDTVTGQIYNECFTSKTDFVPEQIDALIAAAKERLEYVPAPEYQITCDDGFVVQI